MKTKSSRFQIHDDLTAPEDSVAVLRSLSKGGQPPNVLGVLAGSPAALRAYVRARFELRDSTLSLATKERISLAVAQHYGSEPGTALHVRAARLAGIGVDEVARAQRFESDDELEQALLAVLHRLVAGGGTPAHLVEEAREAGWSDEQLLEAIAFVAMEQLIAMVNVAGDVPIDGSVEESRHLKAA
jgi:alkylhydroperoxidase family enzyme